MSHSVVSGDKKKKKERLDRDQMWRPNKNCRDRWVGVSDPELVDNGAEGDTPGRSREACKY